MDDAKTGLQDPGVVKSRRLMRNLALILGFSICVFALFLGCLAQMLETDQGKPKDEPSFARAAAANAAAETANHDGARIGTEDARSEAVNEDDVEGGSKAEGGDGNTYTQQTCSNTPSLCGSDPEQTNTGNDPPASNQPEQTTQEPHEPPDEHEPPPDEHEPPPDQESEDPED